MRKIFILLIVILLFFTCDFFDEKESIDMGTIDIQPTPTPGAPLTTADYNNQNGIIQATINDMVSNPLLITEFGTLTVPQIADGVNIPHGGARYLVNGNTNISGSPVNGRVYIKLEVSGDQLLPSFVNSAVGYTWYHIYNGFYDGSGNQLLPYVIWKNGTDYYKFDLKDSDNRFDITATIKKQYTDNIGPWNMSVTSAVYIAPQIDINLVRRVKAFIINDGQSRYYELVSNGAYSGYRLNNEISFPNTIWLFRGAGFFDTAGIFNNAGISRGYYTVFYEI